MRPYNLRRRRGQRRGEGDSSTSIFLPHLDCTPYTCLPFLPGCLSARLAAVAVACNGGWSCVKPARRSKEGTNDRRARSPGPRPGERGRRGGGGAAQRRAGRRGRQPVTPSLLPPFLRPSSSQIGAEFVQLLDQQAAEVHGWREDRGRGGRTDGQTPRGWFLPSLHLARLGRTDGGKGGGEPPPPLLPLSSASILSLLLLEDSAGGRPSQNCSPLPMGC